MTVAGTTVSVLGRSLTFGTDGMPVAVRSYFGPGNTTIGTTAREVLAAPIRFAVIDSAIGAITWRGAAAKVTHRAAGAVAWETTRETPALSLRVRAQMEFEGTTEYSVTLRANQRTALKDVRLEIPMRADAA